MSDHVRERMATVAEDTVALDEVVAEMVESDPSRTYSQHLGEVLAVAREAKQLEEDRSENSDPAEWALHERALHLQLDRNIDYEEAAFLAFEEASS